MDFFAMGSVSGTDKQINGMPVKTMTTGQSSNILSIRTGSKGRTQKIDKILTCLSFGMGATLIAAGLALSLSLSMQHNAF